MTAKSLQGFAAAIGAGHMEVKAAGHEVAERESGAARKRFRLIVCAARFANPHRDGSLADDQPLTGLSKTNDIPKSRTPSLSAGGPVQIRQ
jgi:hypothetical protein